jgi:hypothetical protein
VEQERRRTEGEWRRIEDDLARMEEERLRERSGLCYIYYIFFILSFVSCTKSANFHDFLACANFAQKVG